MIESRFVRGLLASDIDAIRTQVALWESMNVWDVMWKKVKGAVTRDDVIQKELAQEIERLKKYKDHHVRMMLLKHPAEHLNLEFPEEITAPALDDLGARIELGAIETLRNAEDDFEGSTVEEMAQHILRRLFEEIADRFEDQDEETQRRVIDTILEEVETMPEAQRERLREALDADELSRDAIRQALMQGALGAAFATVVKVTGFSAYLAAVKIVAAVSGLVGIAIPFGVYTALTSAIAIAANPVIVALFAFGGGYILTRHANKKMRNNLLPVLVTQNVVQAAVGDFSSEDLAGFIDEHTSEKLVWTSWEE